MTGVDAALLDRIRLRLVERSAEGTPSDVAAALRSEAALVDDAVVLEAVDALRLESRGAGPLEALLSQPGVTDVLVNGPDEVYVDAGQGLRRSDVRFADDAAVRRLAQRLAASAGRRLDDASPSVDVRLLDGVRFHAVLAPVSRPGTCLSLRVPGPPMSLDELAARGSFTVSVAALLRDLVRSRIAFLISGGTGTGKTTLLGALLSEVDPHDRIVIIEDPSELRPTHPHVVGLEGRPANVEGAGAISAHDLVRQALRMRPDRLVVGEVRGAEVVDMLAALNTGHEGGCCTIHANSARDVPARFEALGLAAGLSRPGVHSQLGSAFRVALHLVRDASRSRRLAEISVLEAAGTGLVTARTAVAFDRAGAASRGPGAAVLEALLGTAATA